LSPDRSTVRRRWPAFLWAVFVVILFWLLFGTVREYGVFIRTEPHAEQSQVAEPPGTEAHIANATNYDPLDYPRGADTSG
jgi:hypothetical protein